MRLCVLFCLGVWFTQGEAALPSEPKTESAQDTIKTNVPLVVVQASVKDRRGHEVAGLTASDFVVLDNGQPVNARVDSVESGLPPVALVIALQADDISAAALAKIRKVGATVAEALAGSNAEAAVITFQR